MTFRELDDSITSPYLTSFRKAALFIFSIGVAKKCSGAVCSALRPAVAAKTALIVRNPLVIPPALSAKIYYLWKMS
jgi:hypothetical protein